MLTINEREQLIALIISAEIHSTYNGAETKLRKILMTGFQGYATYKDSQILRIAQVMSKDRQYLNYQAQLTEMLNTIAAERFLLE